MRSKRKRSLTHDVHTRSTIKMPCNFCVCYAYTWLYCCVRLKEVRFVERQNLNWNLRVLNGWRAHDSTVCCIIVYSIHAASRTSLEMTSAPASSGHCAPSSLGPCGFVCVCDLDVCRFGRGRVRVRSSSVGPLPRAYVVHGANVCS